MRITNFLKNVNMKKVLFYNSEEYLKNLRNEYQYLQSNILDIGIEDDILYKKLINLVER